MYSPLPLPNIWKSALKQSTPWIRIREMKRPIEDRLIEKISLVQIVYIKGQYFPTSRLGRTGTE